jgi:hypothetical protein
MRRLAIFCLAISITGAAYAGHGVRNYGVSSVEECSPRNVQFGDGYTTYVEKETLDASALRSIRIDAESSPVSVRGGDRYSVTVCKAAISTDLLREIQVGAVPHHHAAECEGRRHRDERSAGAEPGRRHHHRPRHQRSAGARPPLG